MSAVSPKAGELYNAFANLSAQERSQFLTLLKATGATKAEPTPTKAATSDRLPTLLYAMVRDKLYAYQGIKLPHLPALKKSNAVEELDAAWKWLGGDKCVGNRKIEAGLLELASEAIAREVRWRPVTTNHAQAVAVYLSQIPQAVDRAFPGYHHNGILLKVAEMIGKGDLPNQPLEEE